ncbi:exonuclease domain-containing protein [Bacterioplanoides pacificum]|uniref:Exonuclease domain-containing protein n=1 Tax=Bacterioplanoides pacificum TaxID=1171596 RepID=A0ABV7VP96_9GAMM
MNNFLIVDLECTCDSPVNFPKDEIEVIEIGAVIGSITELGFDLLSKKQIYVMPTVHTVLTEFCRDLTGITQEEVDLANVLGEALQDFDLWLREYSPVAWGSWGNFDRKQFGSECARKGLNDPLHGVSHINIKQGFARKYGHRVGLGRAVSILGLEFQGKAHSGVVDAENIARLLSSSESICSYIHKRIS